MSVSKHDSAIQILVSQPERVHFLRPANLRFLRGEIPKPSIPDVWKGWKPISYGVMGIGAIAVALVIAYLLIGLIFFGLGVRVEGVISDDYETVSYHYQSNGKDYDLTFDKDRARPISSTLKLIYLPFLPSIAMLEREIPNLSSDAFLSGMLAVLVLAGGYAMSNATVNAIRLKNESTYVLDGQIEKSIPAGKGVVNYYYKTISPLSQKEISGVTNIGKLSRAFGKITVGSKVAILYVDDKLHTVL